MKKSQKTSLEELLNTPENKEKFGAICNVLVEMMEELGFNAFEFKAEYTSAKKIKVNVEIKK